MTDVSCYHTTALDAASVANEAKVRLLVFNHLVWQVAEKLGAKR
jgi:ribonuclease BN (tRNA processing enzyme)